jgi:hypothetical protein
MLEHVLRAKLALHPTPPEADVAFIFHMQGRVLCRMERFDEALVQFQEALMIRTCLFGEEDLNFAKSKGNVGNVLKDMGKHEEVQLQVLVEYQHSRYS